MKLSAEILQLIGNGSITVIVFVMWYLSFRHFNREQEKVYKQNRENIERTFTMMEQDSRYKEVLTGILTRLEMKIDTHLMASHNSAKTNRENLL